MRFPRSSGLLIHITSLPGPFDVGDFGPEAYRFIDFLEQAGQRVWQVLPLGPPALGDSPYSCYSAFAGNPLFVSSVQMIKDGWLAAEASGSGHDTVATDANADFESAARQKKPLLRQAFQQSRLGLEGNRCFQSFCAEQSWWLDDFARFESLMGHFNESNWSRWPSELVHRDPRALADWDAKLADEILFSKFVQFVFDQQWSDLKRYANDRNIKIFGDMPIFVAYESADVWANQSIFCLDDLGQPAWVAGVPPDYFSETGQLWGNPLYRWDVLESTNYAWWTARFGHALKQFDMLRVDHFRGFESFWAIPASAKTAIEGKWRPGPKAKPFEAARKALGELPIVAEDLGMITEEVHELREELDFPAMRVLQFGFESDEDVFHRPDHFPEQSVAYTGTHDNDTVMGWFHQRASHPRNDLLDAFIKDDQNEHLQLIKAVLDSASDTAIIPVQDLLGLGSEARMNTPGEARGNWQWRVRSGDLTDELAADLKDMTVAAKR